MQLPRRRKRLWEPRTVMSNPPVDVQACGQSIWYDNISRDLLRSGEIQRMVEEDGVLGITSNPTIFQQAIAGSKMYDEAIGTMLDANVEDIYEALAIEDIRAAADILHPVFESTSGVDGYVSLEVSPLIAHDTATTISEAERLFHLLDRPNVMIKIPATEAGLPAIEEALFRGINVNVTLIFSLEAYGSVIDAYMRGLERRLEAGLAITGIASVASFFVSRIDELVDQMLDSNIQRARGRDLDRMSANRKLLGHAAIACAKLAYRQFLDAFSTERFARLREAGARVQRPLWASTGPKNAAYPDTLYANNLIGANSINTMPTRTLIAFKDHGKVEATLEQQVDDAERVFEALADVGINMEMIGETLLRDGVEQFVASFQSLMASIDGKRKVLIAGIMQWQDAQLGAYSFGVREELEQMVDASVRIWEGDAGWWKDDHAHQVIIRNRLGWLTVLDDGRIDWERLKMLQALAQADEWRHVVLLGMGGSSLAPEVLAATFGPQVGFPELLVLDSTVPAVISRVENTIDLEKTLFIVASKSGTTVETMSLFDYFYQKYAHDDAGDHFIVITDPASPLVSLGNRRGVREIFENPADIGGRYSALSYFGMVSAALLGLDLGRLYESAECMSLAIERDVPPLSHPALWLSTIMGHVAEFGRDKITIIASEALVSFGNWIEQLIAESTGKEGQGLLPVVGETVGTPVDYGDDRLFIYLRLDDTLDEQVQALYHGGNPVFTISLPDKYAIGGEFLRWEFATAAVGQMLGINPFDEPNVALAKRSAKTMLAAYAENGGLTDENPRFRKGAISLYANERLWAMLHAVCEQRGYDSNTLAGLLTSHVALARSGYYLSLLAYVDYGNEQLVALQNQLRQKTRRAVTLGYGPRYLHSTGQLHKGGPGTGVFVLITVDDDADLPIPDQPHSFSILKLAQALGDLQALRERKRYVVRLHISGDIATGLRQISEAIG